MTDKITVNREQLERIVEEKVKERLADNPKVSRRAVLASAAGVAGAGALGVFTGKASADPADASGTVYFEQVGDSSNPVDQLFVNQQTTFNNTETFDDVTTDILNSLDLTTASTGDVLELGGSPPDLTTGSIGEPVDYSPGMTNWTDGLSNEEIYRIVLQSGETFVVERIEFRGKSGTSSSSASIDVRDATGGSTIGSANLGVTVKDPGSSGTGNTVTVRVTNSTGGGVDAAPRVVGRIEGT